MIGYCGYQRGIIYEKDGYTPEEIESWKSKLIRNINSMIDDIEKGEHYEYLKNQPNTTRRKMELVAEAILSQIDGDAVTFGHYTQGYLLIPIPDLLIDDPKYILPEEFNKYDIGYNLRDAFVESLNSK